MPYQLHIVINQETTSKSDITDDYNLNNAVQYLLFTFNSGGYVFTASWVVDS
jgi:hypothetical protein